MKPYGVDRKDCFKIPRGCRKATKKAHSRARAKARVELASELRSLP